MTGEPWEHFEIDEVQVETVRGVMERYQHFWPLSPRQVFYQAVKQGAAGLSLEEYAAFSRTLRGALVEGMLPSAALREQREELREGGAWDDVEEFVNSEVESFLWGYRRNLTQGQGRYVEVWVQKPDLMDLIGDVALECCVTTVCCSGLPTVRFMYALRERLGTGPERARETVVLFFGDFTPGEPRFLGQVQETLRTEGDLWEMEFRHEAVTAAHVVKYDLPENVETRSAQVQGRSEPGSAAVELEAMAPDLVAETVRSAIEAQLDMKLLHEQRAIQEREGLRLLKVRTRIMKEVRTALKELMPRSGKER